MNQKDESKVLDDLFGASEDGNDHLNGQNELHSIDSEHSDEEYESNDEEIIEKKSKKAQKNKKGDSTEELNELDGNN